jgi:aromatic-L-amino-acid decarboxylase
MIRDHVAWAGVLAKTIKAEADFEVVTGPNLSLLSFRYTPKGRTADELDALSDTLLQAINDDGFTYLTRTLVAGRPVIRFQIGQTQTTEAEVMAAWARVTEIARKLG